jgi:hypothetical protein
MKRRGPWCRTGSRVYSGKPFDREKLARKAAALQPFVVSLCDEADRDHAESLRQYAHVGPHGERAICIARSFMDLPREHRGALFGHEIGHLIAMPDDSEAAADSAFEVLTGVKIRYKDSPHGDCLQWITPEDSKKLEGVFEFDLSGLKGVKANDGDRMSLSSADDRMSRNPVEEGETPAGRRRRLEVEWHVIREAVERLEKATLDTEWGDEIIRRLAHAMATARPDASYRIGQQAVDRIWTEVLHRARRLRHAEATNAERLLQLSRTPQGRAMFQAELDARRVREEAGRAIRVAPPEPPRSRVAPPEPPRSAALSVRPARPPEAERQKTREGAIREIEGLMEPLMRAEHDLERALSGLKQGRPGAHKRVDDLQAHVQGLRARYEKARERRDKASNPKGRR